MKCSKCQTENPDDAKFCNGCANKLEFLCPECGKANPPGSKFCNECAHILTPTSEPVLKDLSFDEKLEKIQKYLPKGITEKILAQRNKIEGERKQVTVMFCDMEGFKDKGKWWVEGDQLCQIWNNFFGEGVTFYSDIYRNPEGTLEEINQYIRITDYNMFAASYID